MPKFNFDAHLTAIVTVPARSEAVAKERARSCVDGGEANLGALPNGDPLMAHVEMGNISLDEPVSAEPESGFFELSLPLFCSLNIVAADEDEARETLENIICSHEGNLGSWPDGAPIVATLSTNQHDDFSLKTVDGHEPGPEISFHP